MYIIINFKGFQAARQPGFLLYEALITLSLLAIAAYCVSQLAQQVYQQYHRSHVRLTACRCAQSLIEQVRAGSLASITQRGTQESGEYCITVGKKHPMLPLVPLAVDVSGVTMETMVLCA